MVPYLDHCEWSFSAFGVDATKWLSTREYWEGWLARYMEKGNKVWRVKIIHQLPKVMSFISKLKVRYHVALVKF